MQDPWRRYAIGLLLLLLLAAGLRFAWLDAGWFGVDQARDIAWAEAIAAGEPLPDAGPAMRNRVRLGASYYFFWAIPAFFSDSLLALYGWAAFCGWLAVAGAAAVAGRVGGARAGWIAAAWLATSPVAVIDSRVAWAPAAVPVFAAVFYLLAWRLRPSSPRSLFALFFAVASFATQLHLSAASLGLVALLVLLRLRPTRDRVAAALAGGLVPLLPMAWASTTAIPSDLPGAGAELLGGSSRLLDLLTHPGRLLDGLSPSPGARPPLLDAWFTFESASFLLPLAALAWVLWGGRWRRVDDGGLYAPTTGFLLGLAFVLLLPAEAWYYYLDVTLVPAAVLLGVVAAALPARRLVTAGILLVVLVRAAGLGWWIDHAHREGVVYMNPQWLRLGGAAPDATRARVPTVAARQAVWRVLGGQWGIPAARSHADIHGVGFDDLAGDNGFFARRYAGAAGLRDGGLSAVVLYRDDPHPQWSDRMQASEVGPFVLLPYRPRIDLRAARVADCGARVRVPIPETPAPRRYGRGERARSDWGCAAPVVELELAAAPPGTQTVLVARVAGAGVVRGYRSGPAVETIHQELPGGGLALRVPDAATRLELLLALDGPADLDVYELDAARAVGDSARP